MRKTISKLSIIACLFLIFSSCAVHTGLMADSASINSNNFRIVSHAKGDAEATYIFGIGGLDRSGLVAEAKEDLLEKYPLKENQIMANVTVDFKFSFYFFVVKSKALVTADIVEFKE